MNKTLSRNETRHPLGENLTLTTRAPFSSSDSTERLLCALESPRRPRSSTVKSWPSPAECQIPIFHPRFTMRTSARSRQGQNGTQNIFIGDLRDLCGLPPEYLKITSKSVQVHLGAVVRTGFSPSQSFIYKGNNNPRVRLCPSVRLESPLALPLGACFDLNASVATDLRRRCGRRRGSQASA